MSFGRLYVSIYETQVGIITKAVLEGANTGNY